MDDILNNQPIDRIREASGDHLDDEISGILIGFAQVLKERNDWIDIITLSQASKEILKLVKDCGGDITNYKRS